MAEGSGASSSRVLEQHGRRDAFQQRRWCPLQRIYLFITGQNSDQSLHREGGGAYMQVAPDAVPAQAGNVGVCRVLIVDDDAAIRKMLVDILSLEGYIAETARDGREALALLETQPYQAVLLDLMMPVMDGWELCRALAQRPALRQRISVLLMSAGEKLEQAQDLGADGYLAKPFDVNQLLEVLGPLATQAEAETPTVQA
jgi:CheY-like chemotaxis protein